jgi:hypothetical protein
MRIAKDLVFPAEEFHARLARMQTAMRQDDLDVLKGCVADLHHQEVVYVGRRAAERG